MFKTYSLYRLLPYLQRYRFKLFYGAACLLVTNVFALAQPWILKKVIDSLSLEITTEKLLFYSGLVVGFSFAEGLFRFLMRRILIGVSRYIEYDLRNDFFAHMEKLSLSFFHRMKTGDLMSRSTNDLGAVRMVLGPGIMYSMNTLVISTVATILLFSISWRLTLIALLPLVFVSICVKKFGEEIHKRFDKIQEQYAEISAKAQENLSGIRVVKAYAREESEIRSFETLNRLYVQKALALVRVSGAFHPLLGLLLGFSSVALLWIGGRQVIEHRMTLGDMVAFMGYLAMLIWPTIALGWVVNIFQRGAASMSRMLRIWDTVPEIRDGDDLAPVDRISGEIEFCHLTFSYEPGQAPALKDINLQIPQGATLAIVGKTGAGKSTLVNLILRIYDPPPGALLVDGVPVERIPLAVLRSHIGYVPQETFLFSDTVKENMAFGVAQGDPQEVERVAKVADIYDDVMSFPNHFDTLVGERGITLSGGQKQRTAIARALLTDPRILILDDALSSVDTYTEEKILRGLSAVMRQRTTILISHRISTVKRADHIIVLDEGRIVEQGRHEDLLTLGGLYAELNKKQLLEEELAEF
ncbi:MAG: ABC transporter ATP-binding protein [Acidobacteria bacterium]|nr:ABC transporter ATP-binding protein [Acidobacteriota bacterium]MBI3658100.1 ABC transporter ATP-binding protein [Acidobacteriota bacterium]